MTDPRLAWYRQRAEEEGCVVVLRLQAFDRIRRNKSGAYAVFYKDPEITRKHAREAAHYANLVLDAEDRREYEIWRSIRDTLADTPAVVLAELEALPVEWGKEAQGYAIAGHARPHLWSCAKVLQALLLRLRFAITQQYEEHAHVLTDAEQQTQEIAERASQAEAEVARLTVELEAARLDVGAVMNARDKLKAEQAQLRQELQTSQMMEAQAKRYHEGVYEVFEKYCKTEIRTLVVPPGKSLGIVLTEHLHQRAVAAEDRATRAEAKVKELESQ